MKRALKYSVLFLLPLMILVAIGEWLIRTTPNDYSLKRQWIEQNHSAVNTLILGNSHMQAALNASLLGDSAFNMALSGQTLEYDWFLLSRYGSLCENLKTVVVPVDCINIYALDMEDTNSYYRCSYYRVFFDYDKHNSPSTYDFFFTHPEWFVREAARCAKNRLSNQDSIQYKKRHQPQQHGWERVYLPTGEPYPTVGLEKNIGYLKSIAGYCRERSIRLILISTPVWKTYIQAENAESLAQMERVVSNFAREQGVDYRNYMRDSRFDSKDFLDSHHLNFSSGIIKFSAIFKHDWLENR